MFNIGLLAKALLATAAGVTFVDSNEARAISTGAITCSMPAGAATGDFLVVIVGCPNLTNANITVNTSGYTEQSDLYLQSSDGFWGVNLGIYTKFISGTPDSDVSVNGLSSQANTHIQILVFRNVNTTTPLDVAIVTNNSTSVTSITPPAITPVTAGAMVVIGGSSASFYVAATGSVSASPTAPSGFTLMESDQRNDTGDRVGNLMSAYQAWGGGTVTPGSFGSVYTNGSSRAAYRFSLALRPA